MEAVEHFYIIIKDENRWHGGERRSKTVKAASGANPHASTEAKVEGKESQCLSYNYCNKTNHQPFFTFCNN
jgi:hypothetical protein